MVNYDIMEIIFHISLQSIFGAEQQPFHLVIVIRNLTMKSHYNNNENKFICWCKTSIHTYNIVDLTPLGILHYHIYVNCLKTIFEMEEMVETHNNHFIALKFQ